MKSWYCGSCGCVSEAEVTFDETCKSCGDPVYWDSTTGEDEEVEDDDNKTD